MTPAEPRFPTTTVMTCRDASTIFAFIQKASNGRRRGMPPGISSLEDLRAVMRGGVAFFLAYKSPTGTGELEPAGAIGYRWERGTLRIFHVAVAEQYRRSGVARRLLDAVEAVGMALGTKHVSLTVGSEADQRGLFEAAGYYASANASDTGRVHLSKAFSERLV
jgi:ribosomal protein S18 acetylase RimI-like enzyme